MFSKAEQCGFQMHGQYMYDVTEVSYYCFHKTNIKEGVLLLCIAETWLFMVVNNHLNNI